MPLSVKNKIRLGTLFLFLLMLLIGGVGIFYTAKLKEEAKAVLKDNYESLIYCHSMQQQINDLHVNYDSSIIRFKKALDKESSDITEPGEADAVHFTEIYFDKLKAGDTTQQNIHDLQVEIQKILAINLNAIQIKNDKAKAIADKALVYIITLAGIIFLISFTFIINFPFFITNPIRAFSEAIQQIANKNYRHRIHIDSKDEFGQLAGSFNQMAEKLEYFESSNLNQLLFEKSRAEAVINSLKDASIGIDKNNKILFANYQALQLLGLQIQDIVGKPAGDVMRKNDLFRFLLENETSVPFKIVLENRENYFVKEIIEVAQDEMNSKVIVVKNITSFKELDLAKTNFIATISHELKTPLASSDFSLKLLEDKNTALSPQQKELVENLKQDNQRMLKILSELLNMSQVEAGRIQLNIQTVDPLQIISKALETVIVTAKEKGIQIKNVSEKKLPLINADAEKTTWVLNNFLTNAIKYSNTNSVIEISAQNHNNNILFSVKDHGPGIAHEFQNRIFEKYFQVPGAKEKGTGLGLAISKEFIDAQNGKIWVESEIGLGAMFCFELKTK
ncbi:MAG: ATP-binding protein [Bacteroidota bacterium]|nr:ATP-binding protein [Bacteroidota bacterium]